MVILLILYTHREIWVDLLTAFNGVWCDLQRHRSPCGLLDVNTENHPDPCVLTPYICFPFSQLNVWITQLEDPSAVDPVRWYEEFKLTQNLQSFKRKSTRRIRRPLRSNWTVIYTLNTSVDSRGGSFTLGAISHAWKWLQSRQQKINTTTERPLHLTQTLG